MTTAMDIVSRGRLLRRMGIQPWYPRTTLASDIAICEPAVSAPSAEPAQSADRPESRPPQGFSGLSDMASDIGDMAKPVGMPESRPSSEHRLPESSMPVATICFDRKILFMLHCELGENGPWLPDMHSRLLGDMAFACGDRRSTPPQDLQALDDAPDKSVLWELVRERADNLPVVLLGHSIVERLGLSVSPGKSGKHDDIVWLQTLHPVDMLNNAGAKRMVWQHLRGLPGDGGHG